MFSAVAPFDAVFVGSGVNSLTGAALLARGGWRVCVLERNELLGGAIRTSDELTAPGFTHELMASWHPLFAGSAAYAELGDDLRRHGLEYLNSDLPTATLFPDGGAAFLTTSLDDNIAEFERHAAGDGAAWARQFEQFMASAEQSFGVLSAELWSTQGLNLARKAYSTFGRRGLLAFAGSTLVSARDWLGATFESERAHGLLAPWVLHTGLGPEQALSGFMTQVIACAIQLGGMPVPRGGGVRLVEALAAIVRENGGELRTGADVERVLVSSIGAYGVMLADGERLYAGKAVIASVTPTQLYGRLLRKEQTPAEVWESAQGFRYGRAGMQIHLALDEAPQWASPEAERLARTAMVHVTPGLNGVSRAVNEAERGLLPAEATIVAGQPCAVDPSRAPEGKSVLWIQLQELPQRPTGDALGEIDVGDGTWTEGLREAYADRIVARLGNQITNLQSATIRRVVLSPADLEGLNCNLVGGDIYSGSCSLDQNLLWRPTGRTPGHKTAIRDLWHIGAATHPGPGLGAGSGYLVAKQLLPRPSATRLGKAYNGLAKTLTAVDSALTPFSWR
jgi:phytoene dehydrogenase-like protein